MYWQNTDKTFLGGLEDEANGFDVRLRKLKLNLATSFIKELFIKMRAFLWLAKFGECQYQHHQ